MEIDQNEIRRLGLLLAFSDNAGRLVCNRPDTIQLTADDTALLASRKDGIIHYSLTAEQVQRLEMTLGIEQRERLPQNGQMVLYRVADNVAVPFIVNGWKHNPYIPHGIKREMTTLRGVFNILDNAMHVIPERAGQEVWEFTGRIVQAFAPVGGDRFDDIARDYKLSDGIYASSSRLAPTGDVSVMINDERLIHALDVLPSVPLPADRQFLRLERN
jgi:hypothetical protein